MIKLINKKENIFGDNIAFIEHWDFSTANMSDEHRLRAITQVASICYQNPKSIDNESLYNRLMSESLGLPSSSFEFVPVLLDGNKCSHAKLLEKIGTRADSNIYKYSELIGGQYLLTNYRALVYDCELIKEEYTRAFKHSFEVGGNLKEFEQQLKEFDQIFLNLYNNKKECEIIKQYFKVFLYKIDFPTRSQMVRHRVNWQELSRRYVSGKRVPFEFYISKKLQNNPKVEALIKQSEELYFELLENGVKPQEARRIIPQAGYTQIWGAFQPKQLENYFKLRLDSHAQWEIQQTAIVMKELLNEFNQ